MTLLSQYPLSSSGQEEEVEIKTNYKDTEGNRLSVINQGSSVHLIYSLETPPPKPPPISWGIIHYYIKQKQIKNPRS
jgi:hypothetical protein